MLLKFVKMDPPGTWCQRQAFLEVLKKCEGRKFLEVGCGGGDLSYLLCKKGFRGQGVDFSMDAIRQAERRLRPYIEENKYRLVHGDFMQVQWSGGPVDIAFSMMVIEHVPDDLGFVRRLVESVRPEGYVIIGVPGRKDRWSIEDDTVGHLRRYERYELVGLLERAGLKRIEVRSVSVPVANLLFWLGNFFLKLSGEKKKLRQNSLEQTETSGIREIPFKTTFPPFFRVILNSFALYPVFLLQRLFYHSNLGLTMIAIGRAPACPRSTPENQEPPEKRGSCES